MSNIETVFGIINAVWRSAALSTADQGVVRVWEMAIKDLPTSTVLLGCEALARSEEKFAPNPGRFRRLCLDAAESKRQTDQRSAEAIADVRAKAAVAQRSPREAAWAACQSAFARRVLSDGRVGQFGRAAMNLLPRPDHGTQYATGFDWEYVVNLAPLPASARYLDHKASFDELRAIFDREWDRQGYGALAGSAA